MDEIYSEALLLAKETILNQTRIIKALDAEITRLKKENHDLEMLIITDTALTRSKSSVTNGQGIGFLNPANQEAVGRLLREIAGHK